MVIIYFHLFSSPPAQLRYAFYLLAQEFTAAEIKTYALVRWAPLTQVEKTDDGLFCHFEGKPCFITSEQIAAAIKHLDWLEKLPLVPVRLPSIGKLQPVEADLSGITFEAFLILENLYQGYLVTKDQALLSEMKEVFDYIIIDTAPLGMVVDAAVLAPLCDGAILLVESGSVSYRLAQDVVKQLENTQCPILGVILNKVPRTKGSYYGYGKYGRYGAYGAYGAATKD